MDNEIDVKLTSKQEKFCQEISKGKTQYEAYITAYPRAKEWKREAIDSNATNMMKSTKILLRLKQLGQKDIKKVFWTRQRALEEINYMLEVNRKDMERREKTYEQMKAQKFKDLQEWIKLKGIDGIDEKKVQKHIDNIIMDIQNIDLRKRADAVNNNGIINAVRTLNRQFGFDITKVEINTQDEERDNMKALSVEELKAIAYANIDKGNTE